MSQETSVSESNRTELAQKPLTWPDPLKIPFAKGLIWTLLIVIEIKIIGGPLYSKIVQSSNLSAIGEEFFYVFLRGINLVLILYLLNRIGNFKLQDMTFYSTQNKKTLIFWIYVGLGLKAYSLPFYFPEGFGVQPPVFIVEHLMAIVVSVIIAPIEEEILFRGLLYGALRTKLGKVKAYIIGVVVFILAHKQIYDLAIAGYWDLLLHHLISFLIISCLLVYLYESKRSLLLCMAFHGSANLLHNLAPLLGFLYDGHIVQLP